MQSSVDAIKRLVKNGQQISTDDALVLWHQATDDELREMACCVKARFHDLDTATYVITRIINYTNVCVAKCDYCAFYCPPTARDAYVLSREEIFSKIDEIIDLGGELVCFNGGFNPNLKIDFYARLFSSIRERYGERIEFYAMTVVELMYVARASGLTIRQALRTLKNAGVLWITGGGAEILTDSFRRRHSPNKYTVDEYFATQREILAAGLNSTATMVIGFDETIEERLEHLERLRKFQDEVKNTLGKELFSFLCWTYKPYNTCLGGSEVGGQEYLRTLALARIYLHNIVHIRTSVLTQNANAVKGLSFGADDFDLPWEDEVTEKAGAKIERDIQQICSYVHDAGLEPHFRHLVLPVLTNPTANCC